MVNLIGLDVVLLLRVFIAMVAVAIQLAIVGFLPSRNKKVKQCSINNWVVIIKTLYLIWVNVERIVFFHWLVPMNRSILVIPFQMPDDCAWL